MSTAEAGPSDALPVTVIGGYLGAGKTTFVNHLLRHADGVRLAVLVNEFGELPIDADLIEAQDENVIAIVGGCVCCSYGNDLIMALIDLAQMKPRPQRVLLEASGVALPGAIASSIELLQQYRLDGVIVLADAETVRTRAKDPYMGDTVVRQLEDADLIVLNKIDLASEPALSETRTWLAGHFENAKVLSTKQARLPLDIALGAIQLEGRLQRRKRAHHDNQFATLSLTFKDPINPNLLADALTAPALGVVRAKGFVKAGDGQIYEIQVVGSRSSAVPAPTAAKPTGIVCIGINSLLDSSLIERAIADAGAASQAAC